MSLNLLVLCLLFWRNMALSSVASIMSRKLMPKLVVFDLDDCLWSPEMYTLSDVPTSTSAVKSKLGDLEEEGVIAVKSGRSLIRLYPAGGL